ncbi:MAG: GNAT family N-acetyltransferase [Pseudomonadota bacterium]
MRIVEADLEDARTVDLLRTHFTTARAATAPGSAHALDVDGLRAPEVEVWALWDGDDLVGIGALKQLTPDHGEVKSMHVAQAKRGAGVGSTMLRHLLASARQSGMARVSLETGSWAYFEPALALYRKHGFVACPPFAEYRPDPNSVFLSLDLDGPGKGQSGQAEWEVGQK